MKKGGTTMSILINLEKYINFRFIELGELKGKVIKDVFNNQYDNYSFIVTEDNEISGYILKYFSDSIDEEDTAAQMYPLEFSDVIDFIMHNTNDYFFLANNLINDPEGLYKEVTKIEEQEEKENQKLLKEQRYQQYLHLKKEFEDK